MLVIHLPIAGLSIIKWRNNSIDLICLATIQHLNGLTPNSSLYVFYLFVKWKEWAKGASWTKIYNLSYAQHQLAGLLLYLYAVYMNSIYAVCAQLEVFYSSWAVNFNLKIMKCQTRLAGVNHLTPIRNRSCIFVSKLLLLFRFALQKVIAWRFPLWQHSCLVTFWNLRYNFVIFKTLFSLLDSPRFYSQEEVCGFFSFKWIWLRWFCANLIPSWLSRVFHQKHDNPISCKNLDWRFIF
jgi:hypothetical protein